MFRTTLELATLTLFVFSAPRLYGQNEQLTLEQSAGRGEAVDLTGELEGWRWAPDGEHLVRGRGKDAEWFDPETGESVEIPAEYAVQEEPGSEPGAPSEGKEESSTGGDEDPDEKASRDPVARAFAALEGIDEGTARRIARGRKEESEAGTLIQSGGELYFLDADGKARVLTSDSEPKLELVELSPDGRYVAFVQGRNLVVLQTAQGWRRTLTSDGGEDVFNGKLDWVYQEEIYGRGNFKGFWWSPESTHIAFLKLDESDVHDFTVVDFIEPQHFRVKPEISRYPKVGDPNPTVALGVADVASGELSWIDLEEYREDEPLVVRVGWSPPEAHSGGSRVMFMVQDRIQTWLDLCSADPDSGASERLLRETSDSWVERPEAPFWLADSSFLWGSHRGGHRHLYRYRLDGTLIGAVTGGDWSVRTLMAVDEESGRLWFTANKDGAVDQNVYRIGLDGRDLVRLTRTRGWHSIQFDEEKRFFIDRVSSLSQPPEVLLCDAEGEVVRVLAQSEPGDRERFALSKWELQQVPARDGFMLDVAVLKPVPFDAKASYPVWLATYSGPDAPTVRNRWNGSAWYQFLAQQGMIVLQVNVRSASGRGHWATESCYLRAGVVELSDLEDAVRWLTSEPWADAERVGITGYSYGGFMSAYALTHSDLFALGVAGGGVYDWRMYDTIYTERYMSTPERNPEGYAQTSVLEAAENLNGHLVLHHGAMDDNVHMQNVMQLVFALQKAGRPFDLMLFPQSRHGVRNSDQRWFLRCLEWQAIQEHLRSPGSRAPWPQPRTEAESTAEGGPPAAESAVRSAR